MHNKNVRKATFSNLLVGEGELYVSICNAELFFQEILFTLYALRIGWNDLIQ